MNWTERILKNRKLKSSQTENTYSEEVGQIIDRMPTAFGHWVAIAVIVFSALLFLFGWIIKYPDAVVGQIKINSNQGPVKLVANASGNIQLHLFQPQNQVKEGDYIATIKNPAKTEDILTISHLTDTFDPNEIITPEIIGQFPEKVSLGDLNLKYHTFLSALYNQYDYHNDNIFEKQKAGLCNELKWKKEILKESREMLKVSSQRFDISQKWFEKYKSLNKNKIITYEQEVDKSLTEYLMIQQEVQNLKKEITSIQMQIEEIQNHLTLLHTQQKEKERELKLNLLVAYHELKNNIKAWEEKFVFKVPFNGKLEFLKFLVDGQYIQMGEEVFGIVPKETKVRGQLLLPSSGAGKVKKGDRVTIKLNDYPYTEYGSIDGYVNSISLITQTQKLEQSLVETYLISVELPDGLKTNYGTILDYKPDIGGTANIIVKERRLIERLFDNLKYNTK